MLRRFFAILLYCSQWHNPAFGLDVAALNRMAAADRLTWVTQFVAEELNKKDSTAAFAETNLLFDLAKRWNAPDITAEIYTGQGNYRLYVLHDPVGARNLYARGIDFANLHDLKIAAAAMLLQIGSSYCQENQPVLAYEYYFRAHDVFAQVGFDRITHIDQYEYDIGYFLYGLEDYKSAMVHLSIAEQFPYGARQVRYKVLMLMGWCCDRLNLDQDALGYLQKRAQLAQQENNSTWIGESAVDIGEHHLQDACYAEARIYLMTGYHLSIQAGQFQTAAKALIALSKVNIHEGNLHAAAEKLTEAANYLHQAGAENAYPDLYAGWMLIYEQSDDFREAYRYRQLYDYAHDSIRRATEMRTYTNIQVRLDGRRHLMQMEQVQKAEHTDQLLILLAACLAAILGGGIYIGWKYQRRQKSLVLARQQAEWALEQALQQVSHQQDEEAQPLANIPSTNPLPLSPDPKTEQISKEALEQILQLILLTEEDSRRFRLFFEKIYPGFFTQLRARYPDLTQSETRLLALTKLNLNTREMSEILNVEPNSIRRLRNRIRQKFNLPTGDNLENLITMY